MNNLRILNASENSRIEDGGLISTFSGLNLFELNA